MSEQERVSMDFIVCGTDDQVSLFKRESHHIPFQFGETRGNYSRYNCLLASRDFVLQAAMRNNVTLEEVFGPWDDNSAYEVLVQGEHPAWSNRDKSIYG